MADDSKIKFYSDVFPSPIAPDTVKKSKAYGLAVGQAIQKSFFNGDGSYYSERNKLFKENREFANGKQDKQVYLDLLGIDGKQSFMNLDNRPRPIALKFADIMVNKIMEKTEITECTGLSQEINKRKAEKKSDAAFRMKEKEFIQGIQDQSGMKFEEDDAFTPESEEELDLWAELNDKEHEELLMEDAIFFVNANNEQESIKREIANDLVSTGMGWERNYFDGNNRIKLQRIKPEYMVYGSTQTLDFRNIPYVGHLERISIVTFRSLFPDVSEKEIYAAARSHCNSYGNASHLQDYTYEYDNAHSRPYDGFLIDVLFFEYRVTKYFNAVVSVDKRGNKTYDRVKDGFVPKAGDKKLVKRPLPTIYAGAWVVGSELLPEWGEMPNLLRSNEDKEDVRFSYSGYILNNDGSMMPKSPVDSMKSSIIQMDIAVLKIQQHMMNAAPDGARIDLDAIVDMDLGQGIGKVTAMKLREIRLQTGDEYFSSSKASGEKGLPAISDAVHSMGDKLGQFMTTYEWELNNIRAYIGYNDATDGSSIGDRTGKGVQDTQISITNTATGHIYSGYTTIKINNDKGIALRLWDTLKQADVNSMYMRILGKHNVDFIKKRKDITSSNYDVMIAVDKTHEDKAFLENNIALALQSGLIELQDAEVVRDYAKTNKRKAIKYLAFIQKSRKKQTQKDALEAQTKAQESQGALVAQQQEIAFQEQQRKDALEMEKEKVKAKLMMDLEHQKLVNAAVLKMMEAGGTQLPDYVKMLMTKEQNEAMEAMEAEHEAELAEQQALAQEQEMMEAEGGMSEEQMM